MCSFLYEQSDFHPTRGLTLEIGNRSSIPNETVSQYHQEFFTHPKVGSKLVLLHPKVFAFLVLFCVLPAGKLT